MQFLADLRYAVHGSYYDTGFYFILTYSVQFKYEVFKMSCCGSLNDSFFPKVL